MPQQLICIKSCWRDMLNGCHDSIRNTWGRFYPGSIRFFIGWREVDEARMKYGPLKEDEIFLSDVKDSYDDLIQKTQTIVRRSKAQNLEGVFLADNDTFVYPNLFTKVDTQDYAGQLEKGRYMHGGLGYYLSKKSIEILSVAPIDDSFRKSGFNEDLWVGSNLLPNTKAFDIRKFSEHHPDWCHDRGLKASDVSKVGWQEKVFQEYINGKDAGTNTQR
jgi:hypothetical protein